MHSPCIGTEIPHVCYCVHHRATWKFTLRDCLWVCNRWLCCCVHTHQWLQIVYLKLEMLSFLMPTHIHTACIHNTHTRSSLFRHTMFCWAKTRHFTRYSNAGYVNTTLSLVPIQTRGNGLWHHRYEDCFSWRQVYASLKRLGYIVYKTMLRSDTSICMCCVTL